MNATTTGNPGFEPIPDAPGAKWGGGYEIRHIRLQLKPRAKNGPLEFELLEIKQPPPPPVARLDEYLQQLAAHEIAERTGEPVSPYDIDVTRQCWVIFELGREVPNWRFYGPGLTKKAKPQGWEFGLKYVLADGTIDKGEIPDAADCKLLAMAVARRDAKDHQYFNLHVEFVQGAGTTSDPIKRLKVIFDPDVGNTGGFFPPPPE